MTLWENCDSSICLFSLLLYIKAVQLFGRVAAGSQALALSVNIQLSNQKVTIGRTVKESQMIYLQSKVVLLAVVLSFSSMNHASAHDHISHQQSPHLPI